MTPAIKASARHWMIGIMLAVVGVTLSRVVAPGFAERMRAVVAITGQLLALAGLFIISVGIRRRLHRANADAPPVG